MFSHIMKHRRLTVEKRQNPSACTNFYISPTMGQVVNSLDPLPITWNATCLSVPAIDIYLYSPDAALPRIHVWEGVASSRGTYNATLVPTWWNSTSSQSLQVSIVNSGQPPFLSTMPGGPVFNATYDSSSSSQPSADTSQVTSGITQVNDLPNTSTSSLSAGKKAAAVLITLLFVGLGIAGYIKYKRYKGRKERKRWTEAVDKRMSTISTDWKSVSVAGANAAIRNSIAVGNRSSAFSFGAIRPSSSTFAVEYGDDDEKRSVSQTSTGVGLRSPGSPISTERVSRVSFAPDTRISRSSAADSRPSIESRRTRAFHVGYVPPVPSLPDTDSTFTIAVDDSDSGSLSPRQSQGPLTLTPDDIRARIASNKLPRSITPNEMSNSGNDIDEVMPALRMMRTGSDPSAPDDLLLNPPEAVHPSYVVTSTTTATSAPQQATSPVISDMPMEPIPANVMSPDDMLRAYAERKKSMSAKPLTSSPSLSATTGPINYPKAVVKKRSVRASLKRVLFNSTTRNVNPTNNNNNNTSDDAYGGMVAAHGQTDVRTLSPIEPYGDDENVAGTMGGTAHPFGYHPNAYTGGNYAIEEEQEEEQVVDGGLAGRGAGGAAGGAVYYAHAC